LIKKIEDCVNIKFLVKLKKTATDMFILLHEEDGENTFLRTCMFEWYKWFSEGREDVEDDEMTSCPVMKTGKMWKR
jgi:hypothetical protein